MILHLVQDLQGPGYLLQRWDRGPKQLHVPAEAPGSHPALWQSLERNTIKAVRSCDLEGSERGKVSLVQ